MAPRTKGATVFCAAQALLVLVGAADPLAEVPLSVTLGRELAMKFAETPVLFLQLAL
jgi:hypothetical protein